MLERVYIQKGEIPMISASLTKAERRAIYERDGWRCALCDSTKHIQIHHVVPRGHGGNNKPCNLITLCATCHAHIHGIIPDYSEFTPEDIARMALEYVSDIYADEYWPFERSGAWLE